MHIKLCHYEYRSSSACPVQNDSEHGTIMIADLADLTPVMGLDSLQHLKLATLHINLHCHHCT